MPKMFWKYHFLSWKHLYILRRGKQKNCDMKLVNGQFCKKKYSHTLYNKTRFIFHNSVLCCRFLCRKPAGWVTFLVASVLLKCLMCDRQHSVLSPYVIFCLIFLAFTFHHSFFIFYLIFNLIATTYLLFKV